MWKSLVVAALAAVGIADSTFSPARPPSIPLAVRSPYFSTHLQVGSDGGNGGYLAGEWPTFWAGQITGWTGFVRVDGIVYNFLGDASGVDLAANQTAFSYTSTKSVFTFTVGEVVEMTVSFLSPVIPTDLFRSSLPYSYMDVEVQSTDGNEHNVQIYTDISAEWVAGDHGSIAQWSYGVIPAVELPTFNFPSSTAEAVPSATVFGTKTSIASPTSVVHENVAQPYDARAPTKPSNFLASSQSTSAAIPLGPSFGFDGIAYHRVWRQQQNEFTETNQQADWGYWYYATKQGAGLTYQSGEDIKVRGQFLANGTLADTQDTNYRPINDDYPVFGFSQNLGNVGAQAKSALFQLSLHQQNCVQFQGVPQTPQKIPCLWTEYFFGNEQAAVSYFYNDYATSSSKSAQFDAQVESDSVAAGGSEYAAITSLAVRQAFGALEFTNNIFDPYVFLKEISSDGDIQTVDVIFPFHPIATYANPDILKWMLNPLFINQEAGHWPYAYSIHDLGYFPNAIGHDDGNDEQQPLEECGNMLIMTLSYAQETNDNQYLSKNYNILKQWTGYLVNESLYPANQISTDDFAGFAPNQTNLAIKGMIGIQAMSEIANRTGHTADGIMYAQIAASYVEQWQTIGFALDATPPHATYSYGVNESYILLYNIWADKQLKLDLIPQHVYDIQSNFYETIFNQYGAPLIYTHTYTKVDWEMFCASVASESVRQQFITTIFNFINQTPTNFAFTDLFDTITANFYGLFISRPVVGGVFSLLSLSK